MRILIVTQPGDFHAITVAEALESRGAETVLWATTDFPARAEETIKFSRTGRTTGISGIPGTGDADDFDVVWRRRPGFVIDEDSVHPADLAFAQAECEVFRRSLFRLLAPRAFWVNPPEAAARAGSKLLQHQAAREVGLTLPDTLYGNSPAKIRSFIDEHGGRVVYKPFNPVRWREGDRFWSPFTSELTASDLVDDGALRAAPGIYQELVPKAYEVRVTLMGRVALAARIDSQATTEGRLDWRRAYGELEMSPHELPDDIATLCYELLGRLGLVFGCIDLIVTPAGETVFLEINEMGQFLFVEKYCDTPLLDTFCDFLLQARPDFTQPKKPASIHYLDENFQRRIVSRADEFDAHHVRAQDRSLSEPANHEVRSRTKRTQKLS